MRLKAVLSATLLLLLAATAQATPTIVVGNHAYIPGAAGQTLQIFVTGGDAVQGLNFIMDFNNNTAGGPIITGIDILTSTIFAGNNTGQGSGFPPPATKVKATTTTGGGTVSANGLLATITFSFVGVPTGTYPIRMTAMAATGGGSTTNFAGIDANITNGFFAFPEPSSIVLGLFALAGLSAVAVRKRRARGSQ